MLLGTCILSVLEESCGSLQESAQSKGVLLGVLRHMDWIGSLEGRGKRSG